MEQYATDISVRGLNQASQGASPAVTAPTLGGALATLTDVGELANGTAEYAERIANHLAGVVPATDNTTKGRRDVDSLTDALNDRAESVRDPIVRIRNALARIERRIG
ncbi:hypothetical protein [Methylobacterium sp. R2-1]|uniref:hypothetical protein n=1 Tax=Methylobacterium sp. R2-1 TaxID=2587064 RepID=UPI00160C7F1D|nr:hypothetical protein [Methylobacterium sp. R2-1]MBB2959877.1 hypothetical protein [Methylobacterium sp. R2-1]